MTMVDITCRWGTSSGARSATRTIQADSPEQIESVAREMIEQSDPRAFVTHRIADGRAFRGYHQMPREYYGPGLEG